MRRLRRLRHTLLYTVVIVELSDLDGVLTATTGGRDITLMNGDKLYLDVPRWRISGRLRLSSYRRS